MRRRPDGRARVAQVGRFDALQRAIHWSTAALVGVCFATAAALSIAPLSAVVGRRELLKQVHVASGLLLAVPLLALSVPVERLRVDLRQLLRFDAHDMAWLRRRGPRAGPAKFHPGQKLNAAASAAAITALYATGTVMRWFDPFPLWMREGATFVHDWTAFLFAFLVAAHIVRALADRDSLRGMLTGHVDVDWALLHHPRWLTPPSATSPDPIPGAPSPSGARSGRSSR